MLPLEIRVQIAVRRVRETTDGQILVSQYMQETADNLKYGNLSSKLNSIHNTRLSFEEQRYIDHQQLKSDHQQFCLRTVEARLLAIARRKAEARSDRMTNSFITYSTGCIVTQPAVKVADSLLSSLVMHVYSVLCMLAVAYRNSNLIHQRHHVLLSSQADTLDTG